MGAHATRPLANRPSLRVYLGTDQLNIPDTTWTLIDIDTNDALFDVNVAPIFRVGLDKPGYYLVLGSVHFKSVIADKTYKVAIRKSDDQYVRSVQVHSANVDDLIVQVGGEICFGPGTYVELYVYLNVGAGTVDIDADEWGTFLRAQRIR